MQSVSDRIRPAAMPRIPWIPPEAAVRSASIGLRCPECRDFQIAISYWSLARGNSSAYCARCDAAFEQDNGIWQGLPKRRLAYYAQFIEASEQSGEEAGGPGSDPESYLALPFHDSKQIAARRRMIRAKTFRLLQTKILPEITGEGDSPLVILDLGAGNGWMSYRLAQSGQQPVAVDLLTNSRNGLGAASHYRSELPELFPRFQAEFDNLPFADGQFDCAIFNASFHYAEDFDRTIAEAVRCLHPGGILIIADSPTYRVENNMSRRHAITRNHRLEEIGLCAEGMAGRGYLTAERLIALEVRHEFDWSTHRCWHGLRWAGRRWLARWGQKAEPPQLVIYSTQVKTR